MECLFQEDSTLIDMKLYVWFLCLKRLNSDLLLSNITASVNPSVQRESLTIKYIIVKIKVNIQITLVDRSFPIIAAEIGTRRVAMNTQYRKKAQKTKIKPKT